MATSAETLIEKIEQAYSKILSLYQNMPQATLTTPDLSNGWSVKDTLAHIAAWEWRCASLLGEVQHTNTPLEAEPDIEALNFESYQQRQHWSWEHVEDDFRESHQALLEAIRDLPPERLRDEVIQENIAEETWKHYLEHLPDLQRWRQQASG